jgi:hypothetical protein
MQTFCRDWPIWIWSPETAWSRFWKQIYIMWHAFRGAGSTHNRSHQDVWFSRICVELSHILQHKTHLIPSSRAAQGCPLCPFYLTGLGKSFSLIWKCCHCSLSDSLQCWRCTMRTTVPMDKK